MSNEKRINSCEGDFILASASARRRDLLKRAGYCFDVVISKVDESLVDTKGLSAEQHAEKLASAKARDVAENYPGSLVVGADTIAECDGIIIGKPADAEHAEQIVRMLFSKPHQIITALAFVKINDNIDFVETDITTVYPKIMNDSEIAEHIASNTWQGKAGAYAIQETGDEFVEKLDGSITNVMGMPMELFMRVYHELTAG